MKAITKLLFVALLIGVALSLPTKVRAGGTQYTCNWSLYSQCYDQLQPWMDQCAVGCTEDTDGGNYVQYCYSTTYLAGCGSPNDDGISLCTTSTYTSCGSIPNQGESCMNSCVQEYTQQYNSCLSQYCTED